MRYELTADIFYKGLDNHKKALAAGKLMDNRLSNEYMIIASDIHFDMPAFIAYFDYEKLSVLPDYTNKSIEYSKKLQEIT